MQRIRRHSRLWSAILICSICLAGCTAYQGPMTRDPDTPLPAQVLEDHLEDLDEGDSIEVRFTTGSTVRRHYSDARDGQLLTFEGVSGSLQEFSDPLDGVSGIQSKEFRALRTLLAAGGAVFAVLAIKFVVDCNSGCFD